MTEHREHLEHMVWHRRGTGDAEHLLLRTPLGSYIIRRIPEEGDHEAGLILEGSSSIWRMIPGRTEAAEKELREHAEAHFRSELSRMRLAIMQCDSALSAARPGPDGLFVVRTS